jgi:ABC-type transport system involved in multi-copper enzyme maturation permease subunit
MTTLTSPAGKRSVPFQPARFIDTLAAEWTKLTSLRSTYITLALGIGLSLAATPLIGIAFGSRWDSMSASEQADFQPAAFAMFGYLFSQIIFAVLGVLVVASEYSSGQIRLSLAATPRRGRLLFAKLTILAVVTLVAGLATSFGMFFVGQMVFSAYDAPVASLTDDGALRAVLGVGAMLMIVPVLAACVAALLRSTPAAITTVLAVTFAPQLLEELVPAWWQDNVLSLLPGSAMENLMIAHLVEENPAYGPVTAILIIVAWLVIGIGSAYAVLRWRDA